MHSKLRWKFHAKSEALRTSVGERTGKGIRVRATRGCALRGPKLELPAGRGTARVVLAGPRRGLVRMDILSNNGEKVSASRHFNLFAHNSRSLELEFQADTPVTDLEVRLLCRFAVGLEIERVEIDLERNLSVEPLRADRPVGYETRKTYADKIASGFFDRYLSGPNVMEVGYKGYDGGTVPVVPQAIGVDVGYAGYDGESFPFEDETFDAIYSSHCFEHIGPWKEVLRDWYRILKPGGFLVIVVPHQMLFERKRHIPSYFNPDHKRYYTARSLLAELEEAFEENSYRIRHLVENDKDFDYRPAPGQGSSGCYEIELVVEKIAKPYWTIDDGSVRAYSAGEFRTHLPCSNPWKIDLDLTQPDRCLIWGPYIGLPRGRFEAEFHIEPGNENGPAPSLLFDVAEDASRVAAIETGGDSGSLIPGDGKVTVPFTNDRAGAIFEFRVYSGGAISTAKPQFRGVVVRYADAPR